MGREEPSQARQKPKGQQAAAALRQCCCLLTKTFGIRIGDTGSFCTAATASPDGQGPSPQPRPGWEVSRGWGHPVLSPFESSVGNRALGTCHSRLPVPASLAHTWELLPRAGGTFTAQAPSKGSPARTSSLSLPLQSCNGGALAAPSLYAAGLPRSLSQRNAGGPQSGGWFTSTRDGLTYTSQPVFY